MNHVTYHLFRERPYLDHPHFNEKLIEIQVTYDFHKPATLLDVLKGSRDFVLKSYLVIISDLLKNHVVLRVSGFSSHMLLRSTIECPFSSW